MADTLAGSSLRVSAAHGSFSGSSKPRPFPRSRGRQFCHVACRWHTAENSSEWVKSVASIKRFHDFNSDEPLLTSSCWPDSYSNIRLTLERLYQISEATRDSSAALVPFSSLWMPGLFLITVDDKPPRQKNKEKCPDYYANVGDAIRTLRDDIPHLFDEELNCKHLHAASTRDLGTPICMCTSVVGTPCQLVPANDDDGAVAGDDATSCSNHPLWLHSIYCAF